MLSHEASTQNVYDHIILFVFNHDARTQHGVHMMLVHICLH